MNLHRNKCGVLCLTRNPLNTLMWAHYGNHHTGAVVGIDVDAAGFDDKTQYTITARNGAVVYTSVRPSALDTIIPSLVDSDTDKTTLEKMYLQKSIHWAYEEEVRVVKTINPDFKIFSELNEGKDREIVTIPPSAIKEVYFGCRYNHEAKPSIKTSTTEKNEFNREIKFFNCKIDNITWEVKASPR